MKIGMICRLDNSGLGTLSWEFSRHFKPHKVLLVENMVHDTFPERYKDFDTRSVYTHLTKEDFDWLLNDIDLLFTSETFYDWAIVAEAKKRGVKTVLYTMYEMTAEKIPAIPDLLLCPSKLDYDTFKDYPTRVEYIPVPVATDRLLWKQRTTAKNFIHSASHGGMSGRKGTQLLIDAMNYVENKDIKLTIYAWGDYNLPNFDDRIEIKKVNFKNYWQMWREGDVLIYPQDYNGICLPIIEAMTSGLGVITTNIYPFNEYMPKELLFEPESMYRTRAATRLIETDAAKINPKTLAKKIDEIAGKDITSVSLYGKEWGEHNSWEQLKPKYDELFNNLCV